MSSVSPGLPRNLSLDSALSDLPVHPRALPLSYTPPEATGRERSTPVLTPIAVSRSRIWPLRFEDPHPTPPVPAAAPPMPVPLLPLPRLKPAPSVAAVAGPSRKTLTIAVDAEALIRTDASGPFAPHAALPLIKKLLSLNDMGAPSAPRVDVVLLCHLPGFARCKLLEALREAEFPVERVFFTREERPLHELLKPCEAMLYLSCDAARTRNAVADGIAAGFIMARDAEATTSAGSPHTLQITFDFDGVLADDLSQRRFDSEGLDAFHAYEDAARDVPMGPGPAQPLALALGKLRDALHAQRLAGVELPLDMRIAVVTARGSVAVARLFRSLAEWKLDADEVFCLAGRDKTPYVSALKTDLFIDDDANHVNRAKNVTVAAHMPARHLAATIARDAAQKSHTHPDPITSTPPGAPS